MDFLNEILQSEAALRQVRGSQEASGAHFLSVDLQAVC